MCELAEIERLAAQWHAGNCDTDDPRLYSSCWCCCTTCRTTSPHYYEADASLKRWAATRP